MRRASLSGVKALLSAALLLAIPARAGEPAPAPPVEIAPVPIVMLTVVASIVGCAAKARVGLISSRYFEDGSYVRLQEVTVGYQLPGKVARMLRMADSRVYISGRNLYTWTKYSGYSPDVNSNGSSSNTGLATEFYAYPLARAVMIGISGAF